MTYEQIAEMYPEDYAARDDDKYNYVSLSEAARQVGTIVDGQRSSFDSATAVANLTEMSLSAWNLSSWSWSDKATSFSSAIR